MKILKPEWQSNKPEKTKTTGEQEFSHRLMLETNTRP